MNRSKTRSKQICAFLMLATAAAVIAPLPTPSPVGPAVARAEEHKGAKHDLGSKEVGGYKVQVTQVGDVKAGGETVFLLTITGGAKPKAVRAWVGVSSAEGSAKGKADLDEKEWDVHVEAPKPIPAKSQAWVEVETATGKVKVAFDYKG